MMLADISVQTRKNYIRIAKDLCYSKDIITAIRKAKSDEEIQKLLIKGRSEIKWH